MCSLYILSVRLQKLLRIICLESKREFVIFCDLQNVLPVLKWVRGEPLSQDHWLDLFRLIKLPKGTTLEKLTFGDILSVADNIVKQRDALKVLLFDLV